MARGLDRLSSVLEERVGPSEPPARLHGDPPGHEDRVPLYQLYFLMVHVNLFGGSYVAQAEGALLAVG
jgi:hypothetical protein